MSRLRLSVALMIGSVPGYLFDRTALFPSRPPRLTPRTGEEPREEAHRSQELPRCFQRTTWAGYPFSHLN